MVEIYLPVTILVIGVILPVNLQGDVVERGSSSTGVVDEFTKFTMGNIENGSMLFLVHFFAVYAIIAWIVVCTHRMWVEYADLRITYTKIISSTRRASDGRPNARTPVHAADAAKADAEKGDGSELAGVSRPGWYDSHATKRTERHPPGGDRSDQTDALGRSMFMGVNETEYHVGAYFDQSLMRSFVGNGNAVKARMTMAYGAASPASPGDDSGPGPGSATDRSYLGTPMARETHRNPKAATQ